MADDTRAHPRRADRRTGDRRSDQGLHVYADSRFCTGEIVGMTGMTPTL